MQDTHPEINHKKQGDRNYQEGNYKEAIKEYTKAIALKPDYAEAYMHRGASKNARGQYEEAIQDYDEAIEHKKDYAIAYCNRGASKNEMKEYLEAIQDFNKAINLNKYYTEAYNNRGLSNYHMQRYDEAIEDFDKAIQLNAKYADFYNNRGNCKEQKRDYQGALSDFLKALSYSPQPSPLHLFNLANLYLKMSFKEQALKRYNEGVKIFQTYNEDNLKRKFNLADGHIKHIKNSIIIFERLQKQAQVIRQQAQMKGRTDILLQLAKFDEAIFSACAKATEEKADQVQTNKKLLLFEEQLKQIKKRLVVVERKVSELEAKVEQMEKKVYAEKWINNMIEDIDSKKLSEFYKTLYNMLINHFVAYRMISTDFFIGSERELTDFDNLIGNVRKAQSIVENIPIVGNLVAIIFKILDVYVEERSIRLDRVIADKINGSKLQSEATITYYMSILIEKLIKNKPFNEKLDKDIQTVKRGIIEQVKEVCGALKQAIYRQVFGGQIGEVSNAQKVATLYLTRFTLQLFKVENKIFLQHCQNENTFAAFSMKCFEDKAENQPIMRSNNSNEQGNKKKKKGTKPKEQSMQESKAYCQGSCQLF